MSPSKWTACASIPKTSAAPCAFPVARQSATLSRRKVRAAGTSICSMASIPAPLSALARSDAGMPGPPAASVRWSQPRPSLRCPRSDQNGTSAAANRTLVSASPAASSQDSAARRLSYSVSSRATQRPRSALLRLGSAASASATKESAWRRRMVSASPLASSRSNAYSRSVTSRR